MGTGWAIRTTTITLAALAALTPAAAHADITPPGFESAPQLGSSQDILSTDMDTLIEEIEAMPPAQASDFENEVNSLTAINLKNLPIREPGPRGTEPADPSNPTLRTAQAFLYSYTLANFLVGPKQSQPKPYNWSDDGCSLKARGSIWRQPGIPSSNLRAFAMTSIMETTDRNRSSSWERRVMRCIGHRLTSSSCAI